MKGSSTLWLPQVTPTGFILAEIEAVRNNTMLGNNVVLLILEEFMRRIVIFVLWLLGLTPSFYGLVMTVVT